MKVDTGRPGSSRLESLAEPIVAADARPDLLCALALVQQPAPLLSGGRQASEDPSAVRRLTNPVDLRIVADHGMLRIHENHLVVLVRPVLADPVGVEDLEVRIVPRGPLLRDPLDRFRHCDLDEAPPFRMTTAHRLGSSSAAPTDPRTDDDVALLCAVPELAGPIDSGRPLQAHESKTSTPFDGPCKMGLLYDPAAGILPRLFHEGIQVPRPSGRLCFSLRGNTQLRFRSFRGFLCHGPAPWICGFARRYNSDQGRRKRATKRPGVLKGLCLPGPPRRAAAIPTTRAVFVRLDNQPGRRFDLGHRRDLKPGPEPAPSLGPGRSSRKSRGIREVPGPRKDEALNATSKRSACA